MKRLISVVILVCVMITSVIPVRPVAATAARKIEVLTDGLPVTFDVPPIIKNGRTLVPFRAVSEALNVKVTWDQNTRRITAVDSNTTVSFPTGKFAVK